MRFQRAAPIISFLWAVAVGLFVLFGPLYASGSGGIAVDKSGNDVGFPITYGHASRLEVNGPWILFVVSVPVLLTLAPVLIRRRWNSQAAGDRGVPRAQARRSVIDGGGSSTLCGGAGQEACSPLCFGARPTRPDGAAVLQADHVRDRSTSCCSDRGRVLQSEPWQCLQLERFLVAYPVVTATRLGCTCRIDWAELSKRSLNRISSI